MIAHVFVLSEINDHSITQTDLCCATRTMCCTDVYVYVCM